MFPLQPSDEMLFQINCLSSQQTQILQDLRASDAVLESSNFNTNNREKRGRKSSSVCDDEGNNDGNGKRTMHRDIERQRRQEMANLYASLRSLLPAEYIKGRRSTSDHIQETVNYIQHLQRKNKKLGNERDRLKRLFSSSAPGPGNTTSSQCLPVNVTVMTCLEGVEILICSGFKDEGFPLSTVLKLLLEEGFSVVSCVSTTVNEKLFHRITFEVSDLASVDLSALERKLTGMVKNE